MEYYCLLVRLISCTSKAGYTAIHIGFYISQYFAKDVMKHLTKSKKFYTHLIFIQYLIS